MIGDQNVFLQALISAGIIGGSVTIVSGIPKDTNQKLSLAGGIILGVLLNYYFSKVLNADSVEVFQKYYTLLRRTQKDDIISRKKAEIGTQLQLIRTELGDLPRTPELGDLPMTHELGNIAMTGDRVSALEDEAELIASLSEKRREELVRREKELKDRLGSFFFEEHDDPVFVEDEFPEDPYWASIVSGLMQVTIGVLAIYTVKGFIGSCRPAVANLNGPPIQILNGNPVNVVPRPNGMQLIAAAAGAGFGGRGLGDQAVNLAGQLLRSTLQRTNFLERIAKRATDLAKKGLDINMHALEEVICFGDCSSKTKYVSYQ